MAFKLLTGSNQSPSANQALEDEEAAIASGDTQHWTSGNYKMRVEEVCRIQDMINQTILALRLPYLCLSDFDHGAVGLLRLILRKFPANTWNNLSGDLIVCVELEKLLSFLFLIVHSSRMTSPRIANWHTIFPSFNMLILWEFKRSFS